MDTYIRAVIFLSRVAGVFAAILIGLAVFVICDMVIVRYFLNVPTIWQIDVVTYAIVAATFVGSAYVLMTRGHVNVEILPLYLRPARPLLARAVHDFAVDELLRGAVRSLHAVLVSGMVGRLALEHGLARAVCGFPICRCRSVSGCWSCNTLPN